MTQTRPAVITPRDRVTPVLRAPETALSLDALGWNLLIRQARQAGLLARIGVVLADRGLLDTVPEKPRAHLRSDMLYAAKLANDVRWEVRCVRDALSAIGVPMILLKGAAYVAADLPPARGRIFSDVDFMVPQPEIRRVETQLRNCGWMPSRLDAYDQRYYREWSHQIPPMVHRTRFTTIDVHHTIIPETARTHIEAARVHEHAIPLDGDPLVHILAPEDMVLHSATHLLNEGDFDNGLRDLADLNLLIRHFAGRDPAFWTTLAARAELLGLTRPMFYAIREIGRLFDLAPPPEFEARIAGWGPSAPVLRAMDACLSHALIPIHHSCQTRFAPVARWLLFVRGHYLRMPFRMLIPHLIRKAYVRLRGPVARPA